MTRWDSLFGLLALLILWACIAACCSCTFQVAPAGRDIRRDCSLVLSAVEDAEELCGLDFLFSCDGVFWEKDSPDACAYDLRHAVCSDVKVVWDEECVPLFRRL